MDATFNNPEEAIKASIEAIDMYTSTFDIEKEQVGDNPSPTGSLPRDNVNNKYSNESMFPFVFEMPIEFNTAAEVIDYLTITDTIAKETHYSDIDMDYDDASMLDLNNMTIKYVETKNYVRIGKNRRLPNASLKDVITTRREDEGLYKEAQISPVMTRPSQYTTELGGNSVINSYYQFNIDDDIVPGMLTVDPKYEGLGKTGLGRVYSEMIQNNQVTLDITVGVPRFKGLLSFYANLFSRELANMNKEGDGIVRGLGRLLGHTVAMGITILTLPYRWFKKIVNFIHNEEITRYVDFVEAMPLYYRYVNSAAIEIAFNMGLYPWIFDSKADEKDISTEGSQANIGVRKQIKEQYLLFDNDSETSVGEIDIGNDEDKRFPPLFRGGFDIFKILSIRDLRDGAEKLSSNKHEATIDQALESQAEQYAQRDTGNGEYIHNTIAFVSNIENNQEEYDEFTKTLTQQRAALDEAQVGETRTTIYPDMSGSRFAKFTDFFRAFSSRAISSWQASDKYIRFKIEGGSDSSETISNSTSESPLQSFINGQSDKARTAKYMFGGGFLKDIPILGTISEGLKGLVEGLKEIAPSIGGVISIIGGEARVDIPEVWSGSTFSKSYNYTILLRAAYGNRYSIFQDIMVPLVCLTSMALPRSVGNGSYVQPFVVRASVRGQISIPYGIIKSMTIKRGSEEFGWSRSGLPTCVEVNISIDDLSPLMIAAMDLGITGLNISSILHVLTDPFSENTNYKEYLQTLSGMDVTERLIMWDRFKRRLTYTMAKMKSYLTPEYFGLAFGHSDLGRLIGAISPYARLP